MTKRGGSTATPLIELPTHPNSAMNPGTQQYLRAAVIDALKHEDDQTAAELMSLLNGESVQPPSLQPQQPPVLRALPAAPTLVDGPPHDTSFWAQLIRELFIPFLLDNGRYKFTSREALTYLENLSQVDWTTGDMEFYTDGRHVWRERAGRGLASLKEMGIVDGRPGGRQFSVPPSAA